MYIGKSLLMLYFGSQKSVEHAHGALSEIGKDILQQTKDLLLQLADGKAQISAENIDLCIDLAYSYQHSVPYREREQATKLVKKIVVPLQQRLNDLNKLKNINQVAYVLNHKKLAAKLSPEEMLVMSQTIDDDETNSPKLNQRLKQQLQSRALLKYSSMSANEINQSPVNQNFVNMFGLKYKNKQPSYNSGMNHTQNDESSKASVEPQEKVSVLSSLANSFRSLKDSLSDKMRHLKYSMKRFYYRHEYKFAALSFLLIGVGTYKASQYIDQEQQNAINAYNIRNYPTNDAASNVDSQDKTADFVYEQAKLQQTTKNATQAKQSAASKAQIKHGSSESLKTSVHDHDYFDSALTIHLKSAQAVQKLYDKIDSLAAKGAIQFANGTNTKRYAHAFTMYRLIRPYSAENKAIQDLLNGGKVDKGYINALVLKAGERGSGVKPDNNSIKTSNFDAASKALQLQHLANLKKLSR